jgi:putative transposase
VADLQAALVNDDALDDELQDRLLLGERGLVQPAAHALAERGQVEQDLLGLGALAT